MPNFNFHIINKLLKMIKAGVIKQNKKHYTFFNSESNDAAKQKTPEAPPQSHSSENRSAVSPVINHDTNTIIDSSVNLKSYSDLNYEHMCGPYYNEPFNGSGLSASKIMKEFYLLSDEIKNSNDINKILEACEASYEILYDVVDIWKKQYNEVPPSILCRDIGPELYMRLGKWEHAVSAILACIEAEAYYPNNDEGGQQALTYLNLYSKTAILAVDYIRKNPGTLQREIYRKLPELDQPMLKHFTRCSLQIRKVPYKSTNKLYVIDEN